MQQFGTIIKRIRKERHYTQKMLSENICSQSVLSRIENNEEIPNVIVMHQLCKKLKISIDQVMNQDSDTIHKSNEWLDLMGYYYQTKRFSELKKLVGKEYIENLLYSDEDLQKYFFYYGSCYYQEDNNFVEALSCMQTGLKYTYSNKKEIISDMEIQIISEIGKIYMEMGNLENGLYFLRKSLTLFYDRTTERSRVELSKIFYNMASVYINIEEYAKAEDVINQGIRWARKKNTYFYLDELFLLKGIIKQEKNDLEQAAYYVNMANVLQDAAYDERALY